MKNETVRFASGKPSIVTIESAARQCASKFAPEGYQYVYDVSESGTAKAMFIPVSGEEALQRAGVAPGDEVQITKVGTNGSTQWRVVKVSDATLALPAPPKPEPARALKIVAPAPQPQAAPAVPLAAAHPFEERYVRLLDGAASVLKTCYLHQMQDPFWKQAQLEPPTIDDIRALAIHFAITVERKEERR